jgi:hypothetical protein
VPAHGEWEHQQAALCCAAASGEKGWPAPMKEQMARHTSYVRLGGMRPPWMVRHEDGHSGGGTVARTEVAGWSSS